LAIYARLGIKPIGSIGLLLRAKRLGLIKKIRPAASAGIGIVTDRPIHVVCSPKESTYCDRINMNNALFSDTSSSQHPGSFTRQHGSRSWSIKMKKS